MIMTSFIGEGEIMLRVDRNNFYENEKKATVQTPIRLCELLYEILESRTNRDRTVFDPCVGEGNLLDPFLRNGFKVKGLDIEDQGFGGTIIRNYLEMDRQNIAMCPSLVLMNPPFNLDTKTKQYVRENYGGRPLLPELWLQKTIELFGKEVPMVLFTPYGFRLNQTIKSKRWKKLTDGTYPEICSIMSLPKNIFPDILFHTEILFFNIGGLKPHYFYC